MGAYDIQEHIHRYAVWTAARASQRNFTTTENIRRAIEESGLRDFQDQLDQEKVTTEEFDAYHRQIAKKLIHSFGPVRASYGRVSKIIAIYLKTTQVIRAPDSRLSRIIHPPIDRILLQKLAKKPNFQGAGLRHINWTKLGEAGYYELIEKLRAWIEPEPFWKIERAWNPEG